MSNFLDFKQQVGLITGAGAPAGIGFAAAKILCECGCDLALIATTERIFDRAAELRQSGIHAKGYIADLTKRDEVSAVVAEILRDFGRIDVLVNNAGLAQLGGGSEFCAFSETELELWDLSIRRNLDTCVNVTRAVLPQMIAQKYGRIVNVSSVTGPVVSGARYAAYGAAKAGILGMSKAIACEVAEKDIMVNNVLPGWIATGSQSETGKRGGANTPCGRSGSPEEVANMIAFLASRRASYITGQDFIVDGGNVLQEYKGPK